MRTHRSANALAFGARIGVQMISVRSERKTSSKLEVYLESRSLIRNWMRVSLSARSHERFLARWVTYAESGWQVTPATWTRLVPTSMKNKT